MDATTYLVAHMLDVMEHEPDEDDDGPGFTPRDDRNSITGY